MIQGPVRLTDVLQIQKGGKWVYNGRELQEEEKNQLRSEAEMIQNTALWKMMIAEGMYHAQKRCVKDAVLIEQVHQAQEFFKSFELLQKFINNIINSR